MAGRFLLLDITTRDMTAALCGAGLSRTAPAEPVCVSLGGPPDSSGDRSRLQAALDAVAAKLDLSGCSEAVVFISCQQTCFRNVSLPFDSPGKIAQVLPFELVSHLPWEEVVSDFLIQDVRFVADQHLVLTASAPRDLITEIIGCLRPFKIRPRIITPKGYALAAAHIQTGSPVSAQVFIHLGPADITLTLIVGSKPVMVRTLSASDRIADTVVDNVIRLITGFRQRSGLDTRFHVCLAKENNAPDPAWVMEKLQQVPDSGSLLDAGDPAIFTTDTVSAAGRLYQSPVHNSLNFSKHAHGWEAFFHKYRFEIATTAVIGALVLSLSVTGLYRQIFDLEARVASARQAGADLYAQTFPEDPVLPGYSPLLLMQSKMNQKQQQQGTGTGRWEITRPPDFRAIDVLSELSTRIPAGTTLQLSRLLLNHGQATVSGITDSFNTVDRLKTALEQSPMFKTVIITTADADKTGSRVIFQFRIEM